MYKIKMLKRLNNCQRNDIRKLEAACKSIDNIKSIACLDIEYDKANPLKCFYLGYKVERKPSTSLISLPPKADDRSKVEKLISFAAIYLTEGEEPIAEMIGFVHPSERRKGYFKKLLSKTKKELKNVGIDFIELIHEPISLEASKVLEKLEAHYDRSEYLLTFNHLFNINLPEQVSLHIEEAKMEDIDTITNIYKELFDYDQEEIFLRLKGTIQSDNFILYKALADINNTGNIIIGFCSIAIDENIYCIFDFGIEKSHQNKGYGKTMLALLIKELRKHTNSSDTQRKIILNVSSKNEAAYNMYIKFGFEICEHYDYYRLKI